MKLNNNFLVHKTKKEVIVVPSGKAEFSGVINGNETFGVILDFLKKDITEDKIIAEMQKMYSDDNGQIEKDVKMTVSKLKEIGAIDD